MRVAILLLLAVLAFPSAAGADAPQAGAGVKLHARHGPRTQISQEASSRPDLTWKSFRDAMRNCEIVRSSFGVPVDCVVSEVQGYPTVVLTYLNTHSMDTYGDIVFERLIVPFCASFPEDDASARLVIYARDRQLVSVFACNTGTFSDRARLSVR
jgi:hypothetical protein